ncbi:spore germination protein [Paenibacillus sp. YAF4_2]|uniref:spore germination protein n=1 Tax=Paenibacillus sp. YAF4_2 TaxID=3233085 RepID=UPI003F953CD7
MDNNPNLQACLKVNIESIKTCMNGSDDLIVREFRIGAGRTERDIAILYFDGLTDERSINQFIMEPLMQYGNLQGDIGYSKENQRIYCGFFILYIEVLVVCSRQELLYNAVLGKELLYKATGQ